MTKNSSGAMAIGKIVSLDHEIKVRLARLKLDEPYSFDFGPNNTVIKRQYPEEKATQPQFIHAGTDYWINDNVIYLVYSVYFYFRRKSSTRAMSNFTPMELWLLTRLRTPILLVTLCLMVINLYNC
jgi:hypothetical protein